MNKEMTKLRDLLDDWNTWAETADRSEDGWETTFPKWKQILDLAKKIMLQPSFTDEELYLVETCWEISEEDEDLADIARGNVLECWGMLCRLSQSQRPDVRWQVYDTIPSAGQQALPILMEGLNDSDAYCRRRAILALVRLDPGYSKTLGARFLTDADQEIAKLARQLASVGQQPKRIKYAALIAVALIAGVLFVLYVEHRSQYPYGHRNCCLPCMMSLLEQYAMEHTNSFPNGESTPLAAMVRLYPRYTGENVDILAGITGNIPATRRCIKQGRGLTENESSWVYFPGFSMDDGKVAIIWEREGGVTVNGARLDGHAVGYASGQYEQIASDQWEAFLKEQKELRDTILKHKHR